MFTKGNAMADHARQVPTAGLSEGERLAVVENSVRTLWDNQSEIRADLSNLQQSLSEMNALVTTNNAMLVRVAEDVRKVNEKSDLIPKAIVTAFITLLVGFAFSQGVFSKSITTVKPASSVKESKPSMEQDPMPVDKLEAPKGKDELAENQ